MPLNLKEADMLAQEFISKIQPYCYRVQAVGSLRRRKSSVNDIDLLIIPSNSIMLTEKLRAIADRIILDGSKVKRMIYKGTQFDLYITSLEGWDMLLLIRTGSPKHNIKLASMAKSKGWKLAMNGLLDEYGRKVANDEKSVFKALGLDYLQPWEREI